MPVLKNPETRWHRAQGTLVFDPAVVASRLGHCPPGCILLSGGLANLNLRLDAERVLRVYLRDPAALPRERALLSLPWRSFRVPRVLGAGPDFLVLEHVAHGPLQDDMAAGRDCGRALAEIHGARSPSGFGWLGDDLGLVEPVADIGEALRDHVLAGLDGAAGERLGLLRDPVAAWFLRQAGVLSRVAGEPVLAHADFKASNLHRADDGRLLVLDWEFAWAGPALGDIGQLLRWGVSDGFQDLFARAYRAGGGVLPQGWPTWAEALDAANLVGLLGKAAPRSEQALELVGRLALWLEGAG